MSAPAGSLVPPANGHPPFFSRLRVRLLALVLMAVLPALGLVLYTGLVQRESARLEAQASARRVVKLAAALQRQHFAATRQLLVTLAQLPQVGPDSHEECAALFASLLQTHPVYANIAGLDAEGRVFASAVPSPPGMNLADRSYFKAARETGKFAVGEFQVGRIAGKPSVVMAHPLRANGRFAGVVFASLDLNWLNQLAARDDLPEGATLTVLDRHGVVLVHYQASVPDRNWVGVTVTNVPEMMKILAGGADSTGAFAGFDGVKRLYSSTALNRTGGLPDAHVFAGIPIQAAYAGPNRLLAQNLIFLGIVGVLAISAAWAGGDFFIVRRVRDLTQAARRVSQGDFSARPGAEPGPGELGELSHSFDAMSAAVAARVAELERAKSELAAQNEELERRLLDRALELRRANEDLDQFAQVVARDLQEPLRTVTSYVTLLRQREGEKLDQNSRQFITLALEGAERMKQFVEALVVYSSAGRSEEPFEPVDGNEVCEAALAALRGVIDQTGAEVTRDPLPRVRGDFALLARLFQSLLDNALKFRGEARPKIHVACIRKGAEWEFAVRDHGPGLAPQDFDRVFVVFQRLHAAGKHPGLGLGLSLCRKIVERHGGRIHVESKPGQGATFRFTIPALG